SRRAVRDGQGPGRPRGAEAGRRRPGGTAVIPRPRGANSADRPTRVLVTGAGGPAAIAAMKSLGADPSVELLAADMDPWAAGLYLVPPSARTLIPAGADPDFTSVLLARCQALGVD